MSLTAHRQRGNSNVVHDNKDRKKSNIMVGKSIVSNRPDNAGNKNFNADNSGHNNNKQSSQMVH